VTIADERAVLMRRVLIDNPEGREVFQILMEFLGLWDTEEVTPQQSARRTAASQIIAAMGISHMDNLDLLYEGFSKLPVRSVKTNNLEI